MQPGGRLIGDQRQRVARIRRFGRRQPGRVGRAIVVIEACDGFRIDLDLAAWCRQLVVEGIVAEGAQKAAVIGGRRQREFAPPPELFEVRRIPAGIGKRPPRRLVKMGQPLPAIASLREGLLDAQSPRQRGKDIEIVARFADRIHGPSHRDQPWIGAGGADIVALQRHRRRQHDVGEFCHRRPGALVHDNGLRDIEGPSQPIDVLVMMERVAARPIDQLDIRVLHRAAVIFELLARMQEHVGDTRDRDEIGGAVLALR